MVDARISTTYLTPVGLKEERLDSSKKFETSLCPRWDGRWSKKINGSNLVFESLQNREIKGELVREACSLLSKKVVQSVHSLMKSFRLFLLELSCHLKESVDLKKNYYKMNFSIVPSNLGDTIKETDKDMNNRKIVNLCQSKWQRRRSKQEVCWWKNRDNRYFVKICRQKSFRWDIYKKSNMLVSHRPQLKQWCISSKQMCHCFRSIRIQQPCNTKQINSRRPKISSLKNNGRHFFSFIEDRVFDPPFQFSSSLPHGLSVFAHAVLNQNR